MKTEKIVWYVLGDVHKSTFKTKMEAEIYCRKLFPEETAQQKYQRIMYRTVEGETK